MDFIGIQSKRVRHYNFAKVEFTAFRDMKKAINSIKEYYGTRSQIDESDTLYTTLKYETYKDWFDRDRLKVTSKCDSNLYETMIHPVVRFIHEREITPTGWITIQKQTCHL